jgi:hypothetical protein
VIELSGQLTTVNSFEPTGKVIWGKIRMILVSCSGLKSHDISGPMHYGTVVTGDVILSGTTIYFLLVGEQRFIPSRVLIIPL